MWVVLMAVSPSWRIVFGISLSIAALLVTLPADAQARQTLTPQQLEQLRERMGGDSPGSSSVGDRPGQIDPFQTMPSPSGPLLDRAISRTDYRLGPGDRLILSIFGYRNEVVSLTVTPEGGVIIPTVGIVPVGGLNLDQATQRARQRVRRFYPDSEVELSLAAVRSFKIYVVGAVPEPGLRTATAVTRVSEVVPVSDERGVVYRNIVVRRGAETLTVDLARFLRAGDVANNPFLREGDIVQVPAIDKTVSISGEVTYPGQYEYRPTETLADLIRLGNGEEPFRARAADTVQLMRFSNDPRGEIRAISRQDAEMEFGSRLRLEPFDAVFVPRRGNYMEQTTVTIQGEVAKPGRYPLRPNVTTVRELVEMAGGFTPQASPAETFLHRADTRPRSEESLPLAAVPPEILSPTERRIMQVLNRSDEENVVLDISSFSPAYDLPLQPGDVLFVPRRRSEVIVLGAVRRPGMVVHSADQPIEHFVDAVGGYTRMADVRNIMVLRAETGARLERRDIDRIEPGDRIVVPFRERTPFLERVQTTQGIINTVSGVVLTVVGLERLWNALTR
jgi:polysaccharide biosynthesis/export protein